LDIFTTRTFPDNSPTFGLVREYSQMAVKFTDISRYPRDTVAYIASEEWAHCVFNYNGAELSQI